MRDYMDSQLTDDTYFVRCKMARDNDVELIVIAENKCNIAIYYRVIKKYQLF